MIYELLSSTTVHQYDIIFSEFLFVLVYTRHLTIALPLGVVMMSVSVREAKQRVRERVWNLLELKNVARFPRPVHGRVPNFEGSDRAAERLARTNEWIRAEVIKVNPDSPQRAVRHRALVEGKTVVMATPKLRLGFLVLDPSAIPASKYSYASTIAGALKLGRLVSLRQIPSIDLVVTGCVAVDLRGNRVGKGGGYGELEYAILRELGLVDDSVLVATTVHDLQIVDSVPREEHDLTVDLIATPTRVFTVEPRPDKPRGVLWDKLGERSELTVIRELRKLLVESEELREGRGIS